MNYKQINKMLQAEFSAKRIKAEFVANRNKERLKNIPSFSHLEKLEKQISFELAKVLKTVRAEKLQVLKKLKLEPADLEPKFECEVCKDTGVFGGNVCECFKKRRNEEIIKACGIDTSKLATFENFDTKCL